MGPFGFPALQWIHSRIQREVFVFREYVQIMENSNTGKSIRRLFMPSVKISCRCSHSNTLFWNQNSYYHGKLQINIKAFPTDLWNFRYCGKINSQICQKGPEGGFRWKNNHTLWVPSLLYCISNPSALNPSGMQVGLRVEQKMGLCIDNTNI